MTKLSESEMNDKGMELALEMALKAVGVPEGFNDTTTTREWILSKALLQQTEELRKTRNDYQGAMNCCEDLVKGRQTIANLEADCAAMREALKKLATQQMFTNIAPLEAMIEFVRSREDIARKALDAVGSESEGK